jgi:hypothetical protein
LSLYKNKTAMPRPFFADDTLEVRSSAESLVAMQSPHFSPLFQTVIEVVAEPTVLPTRPGLSDSGPDSRGSATIIADGRNSVLIETDNLRDGLLVLSDNYYPGWSAAVDGAPTQIFRANHTMRAVNVPAGHHLVSFVFMPAAFFTSMYVSLAAAALTLAALILSAFKRRRSNGHDIRQDQKNS